MIKFNKEVFVENIDEAWEEWYNLLSNKTSIMESRDGDVVGEVINATTVITDPTRCILKSKIRKLPMKYCIGELLWYLSGNNSLQSIGLFTKTWERMSDDGMSVNSNYGYCIQDKYGFDQWDYVRTLLRTESNTRQAILHIKTADNRESKDVNCTVCCQFFIREDKLYMTTYMRSNDLWMGFPNDVFQFTCMQILMAMQLGLELGTYTHIAGSLHLYKRDYETGEKNRSEL